MKRTARYLALQCESRPAPGTVSALVLMETLLLGAWTVLLASILRFLGIQYAGYMPVTFLASANLLAWLERPSPGTRSDPLSASGLAEVDGTGRIPPAWKTLVRILLTPASVLVLFLGMLPALAGRRSLPEAAAGVRLVPLDPSLDPRPLEAILRDRGKRIRNVIGRIVLSVAATALVLVVDLPEPGRPENAGDTIYEDMSAEDIRLMTFYLEMKERFPDSIEYHVRLASLYYRYDMAVDLAAELREIGRLDPRHPMLLLSGDAETGFDDLVTDGQEFPRMGERGFGPHGVEIPGSAADSSAAADSASAPDSAAVQEDSTGGIGGEEAGPGQTGTGVEPAPAPENGPPAGESAPEAGGA